MNDIIEFICLNDVDNICVTFEVPLASDKQGTGGLSVGGKKSVNSIRRECVCVVRVGIYSRSRVRINLR